MLIYISIFGILMIEAVHNIQEKCTGERIQQGGIRSIYWDKIFSIECFLYQSWSQWAKTVAVPFICYVAFNEIKVRVFKLHS